MKVIVAGAGSVGVFLADDLQQSGHELLVVDVDSDLVARLAVEHPAVGWLGGDACEIGTLDQAGAGEADVVVAATGDDEDNLVISLLAKQEFAVPRVVARVNHPNNQWMFNETWGVDVSVSTPHLLSSLVAEAVSVGALVRLMQLDASGARLVEVTLSPGSPACGRTIAKLGMPRNATIVAIVRGSNVVVPRGDSQMEAGDEVLALVTPESEDEVRSLLVGSGSRGLAASGPAVAGR
jgi:trk system potassium uptake protein TrkA